MTERPAAMKKRCVAWEKKIETNVFGFGEVAEPKIQIELQMFKIKNEC